MHHLADLSIGLDDEVAVVAGLRLAVEFLVGDDGIVRGVEGEVGEEGLVLRLFSNPLDGLFGDGGEDVVDCRCSSLEYDQSKCCLRKSMRESRLCSDGRIEFLEGEK